MPPRCTPVSERIGVAVLVAVSVGAAVAAGCTRPVDTGGPAASDSAPAETGETGDTGKTGETGETGDTGETGETGDPAPPPLVVVVLADDLGENYLWAMPTVMERLAPDCVRFTRAYTTVPLCCPARASFFAGGAYPAQTNVHSNDIPNGGITRFHDADTLATRIQAAGYRTALLGKYLNGYEDGTWPYVPPGWDLFLVPTTLGNGYDATILRGTSTPDAPGEGALETTDGAYLTGWLFAEALAFLDAYPGEPAFVLLAPQSPHLYGSPATEDIGTWSGYAPRPPSFGEADVSDKPLWIQRTDVPDEAEVASFDADTRRMMENLASLDRAVGELLDGLAARDRLDDAVLVFASDNGHLHGEHRLMGKGVAYEESVQVPVLIRAPGAAPRSDTRLVAMNLDLPATIAEIAGLPPTGEGESLWASVVEPTTPPPRDHVFLEAAVGSHPLWAGVVTERWKYVEWSNGETELYDRYADPGEMDSLHAAPPADADVTGFAAWVDEHRALGITTRAGDPGIVGVAYTATLETWGGTPPFGWSVTSGTLPTGLVLDPDGVLRGVPTEAGVFAATFQVTDGVDSPVTGEPATFGQSLSFTITAPAATGSAESSVTHVSDVSPGTVTFTVSARPGVRVRVEASLDDTRDTSPLRSDESVADAEGHARVSLPLDRTRTWYWREVHDGVPLAGGVLVAAVP